MPVVRRVGVYLDVVCLSLLAYWIFSWFPSFNVPLRDLRFGHVVVLTALIVMRSWARVS